MSRKPKVSVGTHAVVVALHRKGKSTRQIASKTKVSKRTVVRALTKIRAAYNLVTKVIRELE